MVSRQEAVADCADGSCAENLAEGGDYCWPNQTSIDSLRMERSFLIALAAIGAWSGLLSAVAQDAPAQASPSEASQTGVIVVKLSPPIYPRLAQQAHIAGDVTIQLAIRPDGSVESTEVLNGHPMLKQAALESAQKTQFQCRRCDGATLYSLTYTFRIAGECHNAPDCSSVEWRPPDVQQSLGHVQVTADPLCTCDPAFTITRIKWRSAKCLYLWHCESRVVDVK